VTNLRQDQEFGELQADALVLCYYNTVILYRTIALPTTTPLAVLFSLLLRPGAFNHSAGAFQFLQTYLVDRLMPIFKFNFDQLQL
jgi:hypothetical protein